MVKCGNTLSAFAALRALHKGMLYLPIKQYWLDMILSGEKTEEYREIKSYYVSRICPHYKKGQLCFNCEHLPQCRRKIPTTIKFLALHNYRSERATFKVAKIHVGFGRQEWGADLGHSMFIITLGKKVYSSREKHLRIKNHEQTQDNQKN